MFHVHPYYLGRFPFCYVIFFQMGWVGNSTTNEDFSAIPATPPRGNNCCTTTLATEDGQGSGIPDDENQMTDRWWFQIQYFLMFTPKIGEMIQFDEYFSTGLVQPPTR